MKKNVALVTGGLSGEAQISYKSAVTVSNNIDRELFDVYRIDVNATGWWYTPENGEPSQVYREDFSVDHEGKRIHFDVVLLCIHGTPGEDGKLQGYFDMQGIRYTSCDAATSALTMNKRFTVAVAGMGGVNVARSMHLFAHTPVTPDQILKELKLPVFVKPNSGGSSIGMSKVMEASELQEALDKAFKEDTQVLIEEFISGREFTIGVFKHNGIVQVLPITEVETGNVFFDFKAKYEGESRETTPANISAEMKAQLEAAAAKVYSVLNCRGVVRIDFIYHATENKPYMLEINTVPGQSEASIIPQQVRALGWNLKDFYTALIQEALR